jgi:hypothetical protein
MVLFIDLVKALNGFESSCRKTSKKFATILMGICNSLKASRIKVLHLRVHFRLRYINTMLLIWRHVFFNISSSAMNPKRLCGIWQSPPRLL